MLDENRKARSRMNAEHARQMARRQRQNAFWFFWERKWWLACSVQWDTLAEAWEYHAEVDTLASLDLVEEQAKRLNALIGTR